MKKGLFLLGIVGSVAVGLMCSQGLVRRDYTAVVSSKGGPHGTCPTIWVNFNETPDVVPDGLIVCPCAVQSGEEAGARPIHPARTVVDASAPQDHLTISYVEFTPPFKGKRVVGLSYSLMRGMDRQVFVISPAWSAYSKFIVFTAAPFVIGTVLSILLGFIPGRKAVAD